MRQRTFLALDLEESTLDRLETVRRDLPAAGGGLRWVERQNLHLTLTFLGEVADTALNDVCDLAAGAAAFVEPFEYEVRGIRAVPPAGQLRMIWANVADQSGRLAELHSHLAAAMSGLGFREEERAFRPHITLARVKGDRFAESLRRAAHALAEADFGIQYADEVVVYGSELTPDGPIYTPISRAPLGK